MAMRTRVLPEGLLLAVSLLLLPGSSQTYFLSNCTMQHGSSPLDEVVVDCASQDLLSVPTDLPPGATSVKLANNLLSGVGPHDFRALRRLRRLVLRTNRIARVQDGSFLHQTSLEVLDMSANLLCNLTENMFQGLSNLSHLRLSSNKISVIHPAAFRHMTSLRTVLLDSNQLRQVQDIQPVLLLPGVRTLKLGSNPLTSFQTSDLPLIESSALETLDLSDVRRLESFGITSPTFPRLKTLDLSTSGEDAGLRWDVTDRTFLGSVTQLFLSRPAVPLENLRTVLHSLDSLVYLRLNYMERWIKKGLLDTVCSIPTLRVLVLEFNHLARSTLRLAACAQLSQLDLSCTYLRLLPPGSLVSMTRLRSLILSTNLLAEVPRDVRSLASLQILNMKDNLISDLHCQDFENATGLTELYLNGNRIAKLDGCAFQNLTELKVLDLSENLLWTYGGTFKTGLQKLEYLDLSRGSLWMLNNRDFQGLRSLRYLDVTSSHRSRVQQKTFDGLKNLEVLSVTIPLDYECNFQGLRRLRNLTIYMSTDGDVEKPQQSSQSLYLLRSVRNLTVICQGFHFGHPLEPPEQMLQTMTRLEAFTAINVYIAAPPPGAFQFWPRLRSLTLGQTDLSDLEAELFHSIPKLQTLDLSDTDLRSVDFLPAAELFELRSLILRYNKLMVVNQTLFQSLPALVYLDLLGNPFTCDCSNVAFIYWARTNNQTQVLNAHQYTCAFPPSRHGTRLMDFDVQSCFLDVGLVCFVSSSCLVGLTLLVSLGHHFLRWQLLYAYRLFLAFLYDSKRRRKATPHRYDAFVSYNVHDEDWVYRQMLPALEGEQGWRLCLHHRDFQPGKPIVENITDAIYSSRKTVCVLSHRYLQSEWCSREIQMASFRLFDEQKDVLVLVLLEDIPSRLLSPYHRMRKLVKRQTYLSWPQAAAHPGLFWRNLGRALDTGDTPNQDTPLLTGNPTER